MQREILSLSGNHKRPALRLGSRKLAPSET